MWHKPCRTFHPWCLCIKTRCLWIYLLNSIHSLRVWISNSRGTSGPPCSAPIAPIMAPPRHQSWVTAPGSVFITGVWQHIDRQPVKYTMASEYTGQVCVNEMWKVSIYNISRPIIRDLIIELFSSYLYLEKLTSQHHEAQPLFKPYFVCSNPFLTYMYTFIRWQGIWHMNIYKCII